MKPQLVARVVLLFALMVGVVQAPASQTSKNTGTANAPGTSAGAAIGNGFKAFVESAFPGAGIVELVQSWLKNKLSPKQQTQIKDATDPTVNENKQKNLDAAKQISSGADTLKLASILLYRTNRASTELAVLQALLNKWKPGDKDGFRTLDLHWTNATTELSRIKDDKDISQLRTQVTDTDVNEALLEFDNASGAPVQNVNKNWNANADVEIVEQQLTIMVDALTKINNVGTVLLGSTATEITNAASALTKAGGSSKLDTMTAEVVKNAQAALHTQ
ncbi:MAG TPA: hypothetical protein VEO19_13115 [Terriglobia bacterium]|nr:hypothetical protein [Terriglobia bacterium]